MSGAAGSVVGQQQAFERLVKPRMLVTAGMLAAAAAATAAAAAAAAAPPGSGSGGGCGGASSSLPSTSSATASPPEVCMGDVTYARTHAGRHACTQAGR